MGRRQALRICSVQPRARGCQRLQASRSREPRGGVGGGHSMMTMLHVYGGPETQKRVNEVGTADCASEEQRCGRCTSAGQHGLPRVPRFGKNARDNRFHLAVGLCRL